MTLKAQVFSLDQDPSCPTRMEDMEFDAVPRAGEVIYKHDGIRQPYERMFKVVQVVHDVSVGSRGLELYVVTCTKLEFRDLLIERARLA